MAPVVEALRARKDGPDLRLCLTGQHTDLVDQALSIFDLTPDYSLGIMREGQSLYDVSHGCLDGIRDVVTELRPHMVLVQGDTASVFLGSLVSFFEKVPVGHVEAGLRSHEKWAPFPEEMFRRLTDALADVHFAPTRAAGQSLLREGVPGGRIHVTGNTVVDALVSIAREVKAPGDSTLRACLEGTRRLVLLTAHRRESFGEPMRELFGAVRELADRHADVEVVYPVHPNPNVQEPADAILSGHDRIHLISPLSYPDLVIALRGATLVLTDSGGIQEEAPTFGTPVLVLREVTERPEGIQAGVARLVGTSRDRILAEAGLLLSDETARRSMTGAENPYGDGRAGTRIADIVVSTLTGAPRVTSDLLEL
jgi:UDP-N-acetylglucosamine 2-epimerase